MFNASCLILSLNVILWSILFGIDRQYVNDVIIDFSNHIKQKKRILLIVLIYFLIQIPGLFSTPSLFVSIIRVIPIFPIYLIFIAGSIFQLEVLYFLAIIIGTPITISLWISIINKFLFINKKTKADSKILSELNDLDNFFINSEQDLGYLSRIFKFIRDRFSICLVILFLTAYFSRFIFFYNNRPGTDTPYYLYYSYLIYTGDWTTYFGQYGLISLISYLPVNSTLAFFIFMFNGNINAVITFIIPAFTGLTCILLALVVKIFLKSKVLSIFSSLIYLLLVWQVHMSIENYAQLFSILFILVGIFILKTEKIKNVKVKKLIGYMIIVIGISYYFLLTLVVITAYILFIRLEIGDYIHNKVKNSIGLLKNKRSLMIFYISIAIIIILLYFISLETSIVTFKPLEDIYAYFNQLFLKGFKLFETEPIWWFIVNNTPFLLLSPFGLYIWAKYFHYNKIVNVIVLILFFFVGFEFFGIISAGSYFSPRILFYMEFSLITFSAIFFLKFWKKIIRSKSYPKIIKKIFPFLVLIPFITGFVIQIPYNRIENFDENSTKMLDWLITYDPTLKNNNRSDSVIVTNVKSEYWAIIYAGEQIFLLPAHLRTFWALYGTFENESDIVQQLIDNAHIRIYFFINPAVENYDSFYSSEEILGILKEFGKLNKSYSTIYNESSNIIIQINISDV